VLSLIIENMSSILTVIALLAITYYLAVLIKITLRILVVGPQASYRSAKFGYGLKSWLSAKFDGHTEPGMPTRIATEGISSRSKNGEITLEFEKAPTKYGLF